MYIYLKAGFMLNTLGLPCGLFQEVLLVVRGLLWVELACMKMSTSLYVTWLALLAAALAQRH